MKITPDRVKGYRIQHDQAGERTRVYFISSVATGTVAIGLAVQGLFTGADNSAGAILSGFASLGSLALYAKNRAEEKTYNELYYLTKDLSEER